MIRKKINRFSSPPRVFAGIQVDSGAIVRQTYDVVAGTYYPDRTLVPLVLTPVIGYNDTDLKKTVENAADLLTDGHWYRLAADSPNTSDMLSSANEIVNGTDGTTIDTTVGSATYGKLSLAENVSPGTPVTYVFVARLRGIQVSARFRVECDTTQVIPELIFDNNAQGLYDPLGDRSDFVIIPSVIPAGYTSTFKWQILHEGKGWTDLGTSRLDWAVEAEGDGVRIKRSVMPDRISLKCIATVTAGSDGSTITLEETVTHTRRLPDMEYSIGHVADLSPTTTSISPKSFIRIGRKEFADLKDEVTIDWYGAGTSAIAHGVNPVIPVSALGTDMDLGLDVKDAGGYKALVDSDGAFIVDSDGKLIILK